MANHFLTSKRRLVDSGELKTSTFSEYHRTCERLVNIFDARRPVEDWRAEDFAQCRAKMKKTLGPIELGKQLQIVRSIFKHDVESDLIKVPPRYGPDFKRPSRQQQRKVRASKPKRLFTAVQIHIILDAASPQMKAMMLLGVNCGLGNTDVSELPKSAINYRSKMLDWPWHKTWVERRCPLWPETIQAVKAAIKVRPHPHDDEDDGLLFITK